MSNEPVDTGTEMEGQDELEEQQVPQQSSEPNIHYRIKPHEVPFYQRMADYFWRQGLIREPSLHLLARACLNIVANKWAKLENQNYEAYVARRLARARADAGVIPGREMINPRYRGKTPFDETDYPREYRFDPDPRIPSQLKRDPPIEKIDVEWW